MQQLISRLHRVRPIAQSNVEPEPSKDGVGLYHISGKFLAGAVDPDDRVLRAPGFTITVDDVEVSGVDAFAVRIFFEILGIASGSFSAAAHSQQR